MKLNLQLSLDNAAFEGVNLGFEIANILKTYSNKIEDTVEGDEEGLAKKLMDSNGNTIGYANISHSDLT